MVTIKEVTTTQELPVFYIMFQDDIDYALIWLAAKQDAMRMNKLKVVEPYDVYRYNSTLAFALENLT